MVAMSRLCVGKYRYAVARDTWAASATSLTEGTWPRFTISMAVCSSRRRVRALAPRSCSAGIDPRVGRGGDTGPAAAPLLRRVVDTFAEACLGCFTEMRPVSCFGLQVSRMLIRGGHPGNSEGRGPIQKL